MNRNHRVVTATFLTVLVAGVLVGGVPAWADVRLPHILGPNMVIQRDMPVPVWGWAAPGEQVTVTFASNKAGAQADAQGQWMVRLPAMPAGGPHVMTVSGKNTIQLPEVLVGEVWVCSGQSNMEMGMGAIKNSKEEIAAANYPAIRLFRLPHRPAAYPESDIDVNWQSCSPQVVTVGDYAGFSATAYFFGREIHKELNVPVGLIDTSWGGTRIEPWTPPVGFASVPALQDVVKGIEQAHANYRAAMASALDAIQNWLPTARKTLEAGAVVPPPPGWPGHPLNSHTQPTGLYNGMVQPLVPFAIRGALWYQGESNRGEGMLYCEKMKALINGWRKVWNQGDFPFYFVQLAPFRYGGDVYALPMIWEAQTACLSIPNTGMAVTVDTVDNIQDIHPVNKQDVGHRLALWALARTYGRASLVYSGPLYKSMTIEGNKVRLTFEHVGTGLASRDGKPLTHFEIAGEDKKFVAAQAAIDGQTVVVSAEGVTAPAAVRLGWHQEAMPNLMNKEGLPASPFRTDRW